MDIDSVAAATGWTVHHHDAVASTNDVAAALRRGGAGARTAVVADRQTAGRGRLGRRFASPAGGLYVSLLLDAVPAEIPAVVVALAGVASAEAIEAAAGAEVRLKWPNDLWIERRKAGGILLESSDGEGPVVVGIGINVRAVPAELEDSLRERTTAVDAAAGRAVDRGAILAALLGSLDAWTARRGGAAWPDDLERAWAGRLALLGEAVSFAFAGRTLHGVLEDASLQAGLLVRDALSGPVWRQAEHVQDLRPAGRTIS